jgi:hypothetical protein
VQHTLSIGTKGTEFRRFLASKCGTVRAITKSARGFAPIAPLLAKHLHTQGIMISARTLRRRIHDARFRWKRPRYVDSERAAHVGAKKGALSDG